MKSFITILALLLCAKCNAAILTTQPENFEDYTEIYVSETIPFLKPYSPGTIDVSVNGESVTLNYSIRTDWFIFWLKKGTSNTIDVRYPGISQNYVTHAIGPRSFFDDYADTILIDNTNVGLDTAHLDAYNNAFVNERFTYPEGPLPYFNNMYFDYIFDGSLRNVVIPMNFHGTVYGVIPEPDTMIVCILFVLGICFGRNR